MASAGSHIRVISSKQVIIMTIPVTNLSIIVNENQHVYANYLSSPFYHHPLQAAIASIVRKSMQISV